MSKNIKSYCRIIYDDNCEKILEVTRCKHDEYEKIGKMIVGGLGEICQAIYEEYEDGSSALIELKKAKNRVEI